MFSPPNNGDVNNKSMIGRPLNPMVGMTDTRGNDVRVQNRKNLATDLEFRSIPDGVPFKWFTIRTESLMCFYGSHNIMDTQHKFPLVINGMVYESVDHFYQIEKVRQLVKWGTCEELEKTVRREGEEITIRHEEKSFKVIAREFLNRTGIGSRAVERWRRFEGILTIQKAMTAKVTQCNDFRRALYNSFHKIIVNASVGDGIYGSGARVEAVRKWTDELAGDKLTIPLLNPLTEETIASCPIVANGRNVVGAILMQLADSVGKNELPYVITSQVEHSPQSSDIPSLTNDESSNETHTEDGHAELSLSSRDESALLGVLSTISEVTEHTDEENTQWSCEDTSGLLCGDEEMMDSGIDLELTCEQLILELEETKEILQKGRKMEGVEGNKEIDRFMNTLETEMKEMIEELEMSREKVEKAEREKEQAMEAIDSLQKVVSTLRSSVMNNEFTMKQFEERIKEVENQLTVTRNNCQRLEDEKKIAEKGASMALDELEKNQEFVEQLLKKLEEVTSQSESAARSSLLTGVAFDNFCQLFKIFFSAPPCKRLKIAKLLATMLKIQTDDIRKIRASVRQFPGGNESGKLSFLDEQFLLFMDENLKTSYSVLAPIFEQRALSSDSNSSILSRLVEEETTE